MHTARTINNPRLAQALREIEAVYRQYDLAGAACVITADEMGYAYHVATTFTAILEEDSPSHGVRMGVKPSVPATALRGTTQTLRQLTTFGAHTQYWVSDLVSLLKRTGLALPPLHTVEGGE
jgi:hypothetical protein